MPETRNQRRLRTLGFGRAAVILALASTIGCVNARQPLQGSGFSVTYHRSDRVIAHRIHKLVQHEKRRIERFFGTSFPKSVRVRVFPSRATLTRYWRRAWQLPKFRSQCWMVGSGTEQDLSLLSPRVWKTEACEHNPDKPARIRRLVAHELTHVYHHQLNRLDDFDKLREIAWFVEGLAVYVSGQLDKSHRRAKEAILRGKAPTSLRKAWRGKYRYPICGSLVRFIDRKYGRATLRRLLAATSEQEVLRILGATEAVLLSQWRAAVLSR